MTRSPPRRPKRYASLYKILAYLAKSAAFQNDAAVADDLRLEQLIVAMDDLRASNLAMDQTLGELKTAVDTELQQVIDANSKLAEQVANGASPEQIRAVADEQNARVQKVRDLLSSLGSDDPNPAPAPAPNNP